MENTDENNKAVEQIEKKLKELPTKTSIGGTGFWGLLFITFLVLKLTHVIDWSWWWITAPLWGPAAAVLGVFTIILIVVFIVALCSNK